MSNSKENENKLNNELLQAIEEKDIKRMKEAIACGADVNDIGRMTRYRWKIGSDIPDLVPYDVFYKPLEYAFQQEFLEGFELLLQKGADPNKLILGKFISSEGEKVNMDENVNNFLHEACRKQNIPFIEALLKYGADVNLENKYGETPLSIVASNGCYYPQDNNNKVDYEIALKLIKAGADIDHKDNKGRTPLMEATLRSKGKLFEKLIELGADVNAEDKDGKTVIREATYANMFKDKMINILLDAGAKLEGEKGFETFCTAVNDSYGHSSVSCSTIKRILEQGVAVDNKNYKYETPLMSAASQADLEKVNMLIKAGADINARDESGNTALNHALYFCQRYEKKIPSSAEKKLCSVVKALIDAGADVNTQNDMGYTPIMTATLYGIKDVLMLLHNAGAKFDTRNKMGKNVWDYAYDDMNLFLRSVVLKEKIRDKVVEKRMKEEDKLNKGNTGERKRLPKMTKWEKFKAVREAKKELL